MIFVEVGAVPPPGTTRTVQPRSSPGPTEPGSLAPFPAGVTDVDASSWLRCARAAFGFGDPSATALIWPQVERRRCVLWRSA